MCKGQSSLFSFSLFFFFFLEPSLWKPKAIGLVRENSSLVALSNTMSSLFAPYAWCPTSYFNM